MKGVSILKCFKKLAGVALALAMVQGVAAASFAVNSPASAATASAASGAPASMTFYYTMGVGQTRPFSDAVYIPCRAKFYTGSYCLNIDQRGNITALREGNGIAFAYGDNGVTYLIHTTVVAAPNIVTLDKGKVTKTEGQSFDLTASIPSPYVAPANVPPFVSWSSSNKSVAAVTAKGTVTCLKKGTATITVKTYNGKTASCKVTVKTTHDYYIDEVIRLVNAERKKAGLSPLQKDNTLCQAADIRAYEISDKDANGVDYFAHKRRDGRAINTVLKEVGYSGSLVGENIAKGCRTAELVMNLWMNSPGHRANILNSMYKKIGVGQFCNPNSSYHTFATQLFSP